MGPTRARMLAGVTALPLLMVPGVLLLGYFGGTGVFVLGSILLLVAVAGNVAMGIFWVAHVRRSSLADEDKRLLVALVTYAGPIGQLIYVKRYILTGRLDSSLGPGQPPQNETDDHW